MRLHFDLLFFFFLYFTLRLLCLCVCATVFRASGSAVRQGRRTCRYTQGVNVYLSVHPPIRPSNFKSRSSLLARSNGNRQNINLYSFSVTINVICFLSSCFFGKVSGKDVVATRQLSTNSTNTFDRFTFKEVFHVSLCQWSRKCVPCH